MRHLATLAVGILSIAGTAVAAAGYLATVGPVSLHFLKPPQLVVRSVLPPLQMDDIPTVKSVSPQPSVSAQASQPREQTAKEGADRIKSTEIAVPPVNQSTVNATSAEPSNDTDSVPLISPQMFLRFFTQSNSAGSNQETAIVVPVGFHPAHPPTRPSSSATYLLQK